jgi:acetate kinase
MMEEQVLTINAGSSSIKFAGYSGSSEPAIRFSGTIHESEGVDLQTEFSTQIAKEMIGFNPDLIVHRIVHGGALYKMPVIITEGVLSYLKSMVPLAPDHLPLALHLVEMFRDWYPDMAQMACFDTAFHDVLPEEAKTYPLSERLRDFGVVRYGFHGLSFEYLMKRLNIVDPQLAGGKVILAHLGNGASMAAVKGGACIDTTMGLTPAGGLMMGTRPGDLDPGILLYLLQEQLLSVKDLAWEINHQSGLLGLSARTSAITELLERSGKDPKAANAINSFCYQAQKYIGMLASAMGGVDGIIFSGGIAEHHPLIRKMICRDLAFLGIRVAASLNQKNEMLISKAAAKVKIMVIPANEEEIMADHAMNLLKHRTNKYSYGNWDS